MSPHLAVIVLALPLGGIRLLERLTCDEAELTDGDLEHDSDAQQHWNRLEELFSRALEKPERERKSFIAQETQGDDSLRDELEELLHFDASDSKSLLTQAVGYAVAATTTDSRSALLGCVVGNYRISSILGYGGTGTVYLAERADKQYSGQVAVKVVDTLATHGNLAERFRAERQILATLNHPNIGRLLDAGETEEAQPYLVMEYIQGLPLDEYADSACLNIAARLELFLEICCAVQYAHQNLVVHRDLKPANILVTDEGVPKLLDFGIAKLVDDSSESLSALALTRLNDRLLTPEYASPEQILGNPVTTSSDVYALGVVLYELLTGLRPHAGAGRAKSNLELERHICVSDPPRPSIALRKAKEENVQIQGRSMDELARVRGKNLERLQVRLRGDLDAIVMRALRKEPQHRYSSVEQLAEDVRRHMANEPVVARQGNWMYSSARYVRRHAFGVAAAAIIFAIGIAFIVTMSFQTQHIVAERDHAEQERLRAENERSRAESVSNFMLGVFEASDPFKSQGHETTARELLDNAGKRIQEDLAQQPEVRERLLETIGRTFRRQNQFERSVDYFREALKLRRQLQDQAGTKEASLLVELSQSLRNLGDVKGSLFSSEEALSVLRTHHNEHSTTFAAALRERARSELPQGNLKAARQDAEESVRLYREILGPVHREVASSLLDLSTVLVWQDELVQAEKTSRKALEIFSNTVSDMHPDLIAAQQNLAYDLLYLGRPAEAAEIYGPVLEKEKLLFGEDSRQVGAAYSSLADMRLAEGKLEEAEKHCRKALRIYIKTLGAKNYQSAFIGNMCAEIFAKRGKLSEAEQQLRLSLSIYAKSLPADHQYVASSEYLLGEVLRQRGRLHEAESYLRASMERWSRTDAAHWRILRSQSALGEVLFLEGRYLEAEHEIKESYKGLIADPKADKATLALARGRIELLNDRHFSHGHSELLSDQSVNLK